MTDVNAFIAEDWRISSNLTLNLGVRWEYFGFPSEANGMLAVYDFPAALATGLVQDGFVFASNFDPNSVPGAAGLPLNKADSKSIIPGDYDNVMPRVGFAWTPFDRRNFVLRGGYGTFFERTTGGFANSLRQAPPFFRELQLNNLGDYNTVPRDFPALPIPLMSVGFDDGEPILVGSNDPENEFEALETQMISPDLQTPYLQQWNINTQWEFKTNWLLELGYIGTKGSNLLQFINQNQALDIDALGGFQARAGVPGGGFTGNYYDIVNDQFVNLRTPPASCDLLDDPGECVVPQELRGPLLGLDEDEGANTLYSNGKSWYHALQASLQKRFDAGYLFNVNYTFSRAIDYFSDEGLFQIEHDQSRPELNKGLSDYHRKHRVILSWAWDQPFKGNAFVEGWQIAGIGTFQSGRPFTVTDGEFSAVLVSTTNPRPNLVQGEDQTTSGSVIQTTTLIMLLLFSGVMGKSAQFPLHVWLPFAMEAPTPVSALIHAATMVNAGPFLLVRFSPLLMLSPAAMTVIAVVGATTALFAAFVSLTQSDIKKILAYSTISQIGFMIMTCGLGAFVATVFHLLAHGFLKGFLFLSTGNALQAVADHHSHSAQSAHHSRAPLPATSLIGALIFSCIPPLIFFAGPYEAMWTAYQTPAARFAFWIIALITVFFTAMYLFRGMASFFQERLTVAGSAVRPKVFSLPHGIIVLTGAAVLYGVLFGFSTSFAAFLLGPSSQAPSPSIRLLWPLLTAVAGWGFAYALYVRPKSFIFAETRTGKRLYMLFWNKFYIDEIYHALIVEGLVKGSGTVLSRFDARIDDHGVNGAGWLTRLTSSLMSHFDTRFVDGGVNSAGRLARATSTVSMWWDTWIVDGAVRLGSLLAKLASFRVRALQTGSVQNYALLMVVGVILIFGFYLSQ